jgi:hypothetical protein
MKRSQLQDRELDTFQGGINPFAGQAAALQMPFELFIADAFNAVARRAGA